MSTDCGRVVSYRLFVMGSEWRGRRGGEVVVVDNGEKPAGPYLSQTAASSVEMFAKRFVQCFEDFPKKGKIIIFRSFGVLRKYHFLRIRDK